MDNVATRLARLGGVAGRRHLDIDATLARTTRAAGRLHAVYQATPRVEPLLVFVDTERGDHPMRDAVEHLLQRWRTTGLVFARYNFKHRPHTLRPAGGGPPIGLQALARSKAGAPLVVFSRLAHPSSDAGCDGWLRQLAPWPARVLIDLDPRPFAERQLDAHQALRACADAHLPCFHSRPPG